MATSNEIENTDQSAQGIAMMARSLGYAEKFEQLYFSNGASATNLLEFLDDNPGACQAIVEWVLESGCHRNGEPLGEAEFEDP